MPHRESQLRWHAVCRPVLLVRNRWVVDLYGRTIGSSVLEHITGPSTRTLFGARRVARRMIRRELAERGGLRGRVLVDR